MYFIAKLDGYEIENLNGITMYVGNAKKTDDLSQYKKVKKMYSFLTAGDSEEESRIVKVFLFKELANEEISRLLAEDKEYWKGYEVIEYGQELRDTVTRFMNAFKFQITAVKELDKNGKETGNVGTLEPCDFHSMILQAEETKADLERIRDERVAKIEKAQTSLSTKIKYNIVKAIDWSFREKLDIFSCIAITFLVCVPLVFICRYAAMVVIAVDFVVGMILVLYGFFYIIARSINWLMYFCFKKIFKNYYN